ncbi:MAG: hypothetical protein AAGF96_22285 [Bacteroidota bacterium]
MQNQTLIDERYENLTIDRSNGGYGIRTAVDPFLVKSFAVRKDHVV